MTKLQVDVLVQAAMFGPMGAVHWTPLVRDPDALGRELFSSGRRTSGERNRQDYVFEAMPIGITAIEAIKACSYYRYQRAKTPAIVGRIRDHMLEHLDGMQEAPWGWRSEDITARLGRPAPGSDLPAPPPAELVDVAGQLEEIGVEVRRVTPTVTDALDRQAGGAGKFHGSLLGLFTESRADGRCVTQVQVLVARSPATAERAFPHAVGRIVWDKEQATEVRRLGSLIVSVSLPPAELWPDPAVSAALDRLGVPDERWSVTEPPVASGPGELLGSRIEMVLTSPALATNKADLERLLEHLVDPGLKEQLRGVDLRQHSVLATPGLELGVLASVDLVRAPTGVEGAEMSEDLVLTHEPSGERPINTGSIVLTPPLRRRPGYVRAATRSSGRFYGWWGNTTSLRSRKS